MKTQTPYDCFAGVTACVRESALRYYPSACLIQQAHTSSFNFTNFTNLITIASVVQPESAPHNYLSSGGQKYFSLNYRFGFNGKENDNEVKGTGNQQDYGMRIYDPRLGRFLSADPLIVQEQMYPELSPYQFASNRPIQGIDLDGLEFKDVNGNNTNTDPGLILTAADIAIINQYMNSFTFQDISTQMTPQNYNGSTVPMIPLAPNANTASAQTQYMTKFSIDGSRSSLNNPFYSSMEQSKMSATHISKIIGSGAQMSNAVYNYFVTNAIRYGANAAATPLYGDNSIAATDKISASEKVTTQAQLSSIRMDNSFFEFFNPKESSTGPDGMGITTTEYLGLPNPNPGTFYVKTFPSEQIETITALPTNP